MTVADYHQGMTTTPVLTIGKTYTVTFLVDYDLRRAAKVVTRKGLTFTTDLGVHHGVPVYRFTPARGHRVIINATDILTAVEVDA